MIKPKAIDLESKFKIRQEKEGIVSVLPGGDYCDRQVHFLNPTAVEVLEQCNGEHSVEEITAHIHSLYPEVEAAMIGNDVRECLDSLGELGMLEEESISDQVMGTNYCVRIAGEKDYKRIADYLLPLLEEPKKQSDLEIAYLPVPYVSYYPAVAVRSRQFHSKEIFYLVEEGGKIIAVTSLAAIGMPLKSAQIGLFAVNGANGNGASGEKSIASDLLKTVTEAARKFGFVKLKCGLNNQDGDDGFQDFIQQNEFNLEATLENELGHGKHIYIYTLFFN